MRGVRWAVAAGAAIAMVGSAGGVAQGRALWGEPRALVAESLPSYGGQGDAVIRRDGSAVVAWVEGTDEREGPFAHVWSATRSAAGSWSAPERIDPLGGDRQTEVRLALAPDGTVTAVWWQDFERIATATRAPAGGWSPATTLGGADAGVAVTAADVAVGRDGSAVAAWGEELDGGYAVRVARRPAGGAWTAPEALAAPERPETPRVAAGAGAAAVAWQERWGDVTPVRAAFRPDGGAWGPVAELAAAGSDPDVGFGAGDGAFATWSGGDGTIRTAAHPAGAAAWSPAASLGAGAGVTLGDAPAGRALAVWHREDAASGRTTILAAERTAGGAWRPAQAAASLPSAGPGLAPAVVGAVDAAGAATVMWTRGSSTWSARRDDDGAWEVPVVADWSQPLVDLAASPRGDVLSAWAGADRALLVSELRPEPRPGGAVPGGFDPRSDASSEDGAAAESDVAVARDGTAVAVWDRRAADGVWDVWAARRDAAGDWGAPARISPDDGLDDRAPRVVADRAGVVTAAWAHGPSGEASVLAARRAGAGRWQAPQRVSAVQRLVLGPRLAVDAAGTVTAAWAFGSEDGGVEAASRVAGGGWRAPVALAADGWAAEDLDVAARDGRAVVVWHEREPDVGSVWAAVRPGRDAAWSARTQLSAADERGSAPRAGIDGAGAAVAVWAAQDGAIRSARSRPHDAGAWSAAATIGRGAPTAWANGWPSGADPALAVGPDGDMLAVWGGGDGVLRRVRAAARPSGGGWAPAPDVAPAGAPIGAFDVALGEGRRAAVTWNEGGHAVGAWRPPSGGWQRTALLSEPPSTVGLRTSPRVDASPAGSLAAIWETADGVGAIGGRAG